MGRISELKRFLVEPSARRELVADERAFLVLIGVLATLAIVVVFGLHLALTADPSVQGSTVAVLLALGAAGALAIALLPWNRLLPTLLGEVIFYGWSILDTVLAAAYVRATGGGRSIGYALFFLLAAFHAAAYSVRGQVALFLLAIALYLPVAGDGPPEEVAVRVATLAIFVYLAANVGHGRRSRALAVERSQRVAEAIEQNDRQVRAILALGDDAGRDGEAELAAVIARSVEGFMQATRSAAALLSREEQKLRFVPALPSGALLEAPAASWDHLLEARETAVEPPTFLVAELQRRLGHGSIVVAPFSGGGICEGLLAVGRELEDRPFDEGERKRLARLARAAGLVLQSARLARQLREQARHDPLTGLLNAGAFRSRLEEEVAHAGRQREMLALLVVRIDGLGQVESGFGPVAASTFIRRVGAALASGVRRYDVVARTGHGEFSILAPGCAADEAQTLAGRVSDAVVHQSEEARDLLPQASVSIGIAVWPLDAGNADSLTARAERAADDASTSAGDRGRAIATCRTLEEASPPAARLEVSAAGAKAAAAGRSS